MFTPILIFMKKDKSPYQYLPDYILRTPLLPFTFYKSLTKETFTSDKAFEKLIDNPLIMEAIFLASPSLYKELSKWNKGLLNSEKINKLRFSFLKYLTRMSTRCTPFGLFAGCSVGSFKYANIIVNSTPNNNKRYTRIDMNYLCALAKGLSRKSHIKRQLLYYPNTSIYSIGNKLRYVEYYYFNGKRKHHIVEVDNSDFLEEILCYSKNGALIQDLEEKLIDNNISNLEAKSFIEELIENQLLVSELEPSTSGLDFMSELKQRLIKFERCSEELNCLLEVERILKSLDLRLENDVSKYFSVRQQLDKFQIKYDNSHFFQTDLEMRPSMNVLSNEVAEKVLEGIKVLNRLSNNSSNINLNKFKEVFYNRYEEREISLCKAMDLEIGIGYPPNREGDINPLVDDIIFPLNDTLISSTNKSGEITKLLSTKLMTMYKENKEKIILTDEDIVNFSSDWNDLPDTFYSIVSVVNDMNSSKIKLSGASGSSAANIMARFCHSNNSIKKLTKKIIDLETKMNKNKVLAEIVHLPEARVGNILARPILREYEIPYLSNSHVKVENQISIDDLWISIKNDKIFLRSKKLNKEVIPRLTNAHNYQADALPIYHFLSDLQANNKRNNLTFRFGLSDFVDGFLPRIEYKDIILHEAKWIIKNDEIKPFVQFVDHDSKTLMSEVAKWRKIKRLPQYVLLLEGDNELLINLKNITSIQMLIKHIKNREEFTLSEFLFFNKGLVKSQDDEGYYTNQIILSFYNKEKLGNNVLNR